MHAYIPTLFTGPRLITDARSTVYRAVTPAVPFRPVTFIKSRTLPLTTKVYMYSKDKVLIGLHISV